jgi:peptide chain release factor 1
MFAKELANLQKISDLFLEYKNIEKNVLDAKTLLEEENDPDMRELAKEEILENEHKLDPMLYQLQLALLPKDPNDNKNVIVEIRGAAGGDEANIFAGDLFRMYTRYAESQNWNIQMVDALESEAGGFSLVSFSVK